MSFDDRWFWVTAGHVVKTLQSELAEGHGDIREFLFADHYGPDAKWTTGVPFSFYDAKKFVKYSEADGLDFALVEIGYLERKSMEANGVVPVSEMEWKGSTLNDFNEFIMIGLPEDSVRRRTTPDVGGYTVHGEASQGMIYLDRLRRAPNGYGNKKYKRFVGRLGENCPKCDIDGMSGGPVFGFSADGTGYRIVAIQSSWLPARRLTFACPLSVMGPITKKWLKRHASC